jgi:4-hydroxybenzoate polyprenyltransferase
MSHTDISNNGWISYLPQQFRPYAYLARLDRPIGTWLLLLPGWWSILMACGGITAIDWNIVKTLFLFGVGAVIMRAAGCIINDLWDIKFDRAVERTRSRPLASGDILPWQAMAFLILLLITGLAILLQFSLVTVLLGILSLPLITVYPLMKRLTWWPQAFLGITFNFGALMGWGAVADVLELPALLLYASGFFWTLAYDTIYAHQDKEDDEIIGIKSTARLLGEKSRLWVSAFYFINMILLTMAGFASGAGILFFVTLLPGAAYLYIIVRSWNMDDQADSLKRFKANRNYGLIILLASALR